MGLTGKNNVLWKSVETKSMKKQILANCMVEFNDKIQKTNCTKKLIIYIIAVYLQY